MYEYIINYCLSLASYIICYCCCYFYFSRSLKNAFKLLEKFSMMMHGNWVCAICILLMFNAMVWEFCKLWIELLMMMVNQLHYKRKMFAESKTKQKNACGKKWRRNRFYLMENRCEVCSHYVHDEYEVILEDR